MNPFASRAIQDPVTKRTQREEFPTRAEFATQACFPNPIPTVFDSFVLMYGTSFGILDYSGNPQSTHYGDAATTQNARFPKSGYILRPNEIGQELHHDVPEDVSKNMAERYARAKRTSSYKHMSTAAYVLIDVIDVLLREHLNADVRRTLELRTNFGKMILDPAENFYEKLTEQNPGQKLVVTPDELSDRLNRFYAGFSVSSGVVKRFYTDIIKRWEYVIARVNSDAHASYLPQEEREYYSDRLRGFAQITRERVKAGDTIQSGDIEKLVKEGHEKLQALIACKDFEEINPNLIMLKQVELIERVKKTVYKQYVKKMMEAAVKDAAERLRRNGKNREPDDSYLYPALGKFSDARDTATRMGPNMDNVMSQFRKHRIILEEGAEIARRLREMNLPYGRLWGGMNFLYDGIVGELKRLEEHYKTGLVEQSRHDNPLQVVHHMQNLMGKFRPMEGLKPAGKIAKGWKAIREQGITSLI